MRRRVICITLAIMQLPVVWFFIIRIYLSRGQNGRHSGRSMSRNIEWNIDESLQQSLRAERFPRIEDTNTATSKGASVQREANVPESGSQYKIVSDVISELTSPVILHSVNLGYSDMLFNLLYSLQRIAFRPKTPSILVICAEKSCYHKMSDPPDDLTIDYIVVLTDLGESNKSAAGYKVPEFNVLVRKKPVYVQTLLKEDLDVLFVDSDIVLLDDPFPHFRGKGDIFVQQGYKRGVHNSGFFFMRSSPRTLHFTSVWNNSPGREGDQQNFNIAAKKLKKKIKITVLPTQRFMNGNIFQAGMDNLEKNASWYALDPKPIEVHANVIHGHDTKRQLLQKYDLWFAPPDE